MSLPNFSRFRRGETMQLVSGGLMRFEELHQAGFEDHYSRILHELALKGRLERKQLDTWLARARSKDPREQRALRDELKTHRPQAVVQAAATPPKPAKTRSHSKQSKQVALVSRANHKLALKVARSYGLSPAKVPERELRPGQSKEAHVVKASTEIASKLITTGNWTTR